MSSAANVLSMGHREAAWQHKERMVEKQRELTRVQIELTRLLIDGGLTGDALKDTLLTLSKRDSQADENLPSIQEEHDENIDFVKFYVHIHFLAKENSSLDPRSQMVAAINMGG